MLIRLPSGAGFDLSAIRSILPEPTAHGGTRLYWHDREDFSRVNDEHPAVWEAIEAARRPVVEPARISVIEEMRALRSLVQSLREELAEHRRQSE